MFHFSLIFILLSLTNCFNEKNIEKDLPKDEEFIIPKEDDSFRFENHKILKSAWYEKISLTLNKDAPIIETLKAIANKLNIKIFFNVKDLPKINYAAKDKAFIEILSDLGSLCEWRISIDNLNCKISDDEQYMHSYSIPYLAGERKNTSETFFSSAIGDSKKMNAGSSANLSSSVNLDSFEELRKNIEMLAAGTEGENSIKFSIHKQAGILNIVAKQKTHKIIARYIHKLSKNMKKQVLIEAKIYEIKLFKKFATGIDLAHGVAQIMRKNGIPIVSTVNDNGLDIGIYKTARASIPVVDGQLLNFLRKFGKVESVANPRLLVANNNTGVFKVVKNEVYFKLKKSMSSIHGLLPPIGGKGSKKDNNNYLQEGEITSEIQTVPIGVIVLVQPTIDNNQITIAFKPTISVVNDRAQDPAISLISSKKNNVISQIPIVETRELDTVFNTQEGKTVIIGGLLISKKDNEQSGFFPLFGSIKEFSDKVEIVILLRAKIIENSNEYDYEVFIE